MTKEIRPMGQALVYDYDESGRLESATSPDARKKFYSYDLDDRLETVRYFAPSSGSPEKTITFTYNAAGLVESWNDGILSGSYDYDASGRKTRETVNYGAFSKEFSYDYHKNGLKKSFTDSESRQYSYSWDKAGRLEAINLPTGATVSYTNMVMAGPEQINLPGGAYQKISHDGFMRLSGQKSFAASGDSSGSNTFERNYTRTGTGNITKVSGSYGDFIYGYDTLDRLASSDAPGTAMDENFAYDKAGNRVSASNVSGPIAHNANNQTLAYGSDSFEYDTNGNTIKMIRGGKILNLTWDGENRLVKVEEAGAVIATYGYDPFGRRLWKDVKGVKTFFLYSDEGLIGEFDSTGIEIKSYGWKPGGMWGTDPVFMQKSGQYYFYHNDQLGTPRMMTSVSGNVVWKAEYEAFGKADVTVGVVESNLRFPGQYFDAETGLHYNWNRYYEPRVGRYISEDPIGLEGGLNFYGYAFNNSLFYSDPEGLWIPQAIGAAVNLGFEGYHQYQSGNLNVNRLLMAAATGALGGFGSTAVKAMFFGASANILNTAYQQVSDPCHQELNLSQLLRSGAFGAAGGFIGFFGGATGNMIHKDIKIIGRDPWHLPPAHYGASGTAIGSASGGYVANQ